MTDQTMAFLYKAASTLQRSNESHSYLKSYYLMRCFGITKGYGLPEKYFSENNRCSHCFLEWSSGQFETKISAVKLSKSQRRRIKKQLEKAKLKTKPLKKNRKKNKVDLNSNKMERKCFFCNKVTIIQTNKPPKDDLHIHSAQKETLKPDTNVKGKNMQTEINKNKVAKKPEINVYSQSREVFSLSNKSNTLTSAVDVPQKVFVNKRKRDKFAGLCKEAVLASKKFKESNELKNNNKLNLFLKPSQ